MIVSYHPYDPIDNTDNCFICRDDLAVDKCVAHVALGLFLHPTHIRCIKGWFESRNEFPACPICMIKIDPRSIYQLTGIDRVYTDIYIKYSLLSRDARSWIKVAYIIVLVILNHYVTFIYRLSPTGKSDAEKTFYLTSYLVMALSSHYLLKPDSQFPFRSFIDTGFIKSDSGGENIDWALFVCIIPSTIINVAGCFAKIDSVLVISTLALSALTLCKFVLPKEQIPVAQR